MDFFGIGQALRGAFETYLQGSRGTGRTTLLLNSLKEGDRVIFHNHNHKKFFEMELRHREVKGVELLVVDVDSLGEHLRGVGTAQGRTYFDHTFIEEHHKQSIEHSIRHLNSIEKNLSGFDERHYETRKKAESAANWGRSLNL